jgi:hypothetical protein
VELNQRLKAVFRRIALGGCRRSKHPQAVSNRQFSPTPNVALPDKMFVTFYPSTDIRYNVIAQSWFVPFDVQIGKLWNKAIVTSLEYSVPIYRGTAPLYNYKVEARLGIFF